MVYDPSMDVVVKFYASWDGKSSDLAPEFLAAAKHFVKDSSVLFGEVDVMKNEMPKLPYPNNGLEPAISAETLTYHYGKHLQTYVTNLTNLTAGTAYEQKEVEDIVATAPDGAIFNNAGQVVGQYKKARRGTLQGIS